MMKCIVTASKQQLKSIGCYRNLTGKKVKYICDYPSGYSEISVDPPKSISDLLGDRAKREKYDIPKKWLKLFV